MHPQLIEKLASQRHNEIHREAAERHLATTAGGPRETIKQRAGWTLIHVGLKLTGPPAPPRTASL
jgi:hypothetical protein